jgi:hypothetical protein
MENQVCISCGSSNLKPILDLGNHAWCNLLLKKEDIGKEKKYPLRMIYCNDCTLFQLDKESQVPKEEMFSNHAYLSGTTNSLKNHFYNINKEIVEQFNIKSDDKVVEFGSNDGSCLKQFKKLGCNNVIGVESAKNIAQIANDNGIYTIDEYFSEECVDKHFNGNRAKIITCAGVFFHMNRENIHSVIRGIKKLLDKDGIFVIHFMYLGDVLKNCTFDQLYAEHFYMLSIKSLKNLLSPYGLEIFDAQHCDIHGGTIVAKICNKESELYKLRTERLFMLEALDEELVNEKTINEFANKVISKKDELREFLIDIKNKENCKIYALGAPAKGNTFLTYFNIDNSIVGAALEINDMKFGYYTPVSHIPIIKEDKNNIEDGSYLLVLAWNFFDEILEKNKDLLDRNIKFILPFPEIKIITKDNVYTKL